MMDDCAARRKILVQSYLVSACWLEVFDSRFGLETLSFLLYLLLRQRRLSWSVSFCFFQFFFFSSSMILYFCSRERSDGRLVSHYLSDKTWREATQAPKWR